MSATAKRVAPYALLALGAAGGLYVLNRFFGKGKKAKAGKIVAVTGVTGYLAGEVVKQLQAAGYKVRGTVRNLTDAKRKMLETSFPGIELFVADLLEAESFAACFAGVEAVMHVASPFIPVVENPQRDLIDPALKGTDHVLRAAKLAGAKKVIVTSSCAAVVNINSVPGKVHNEEDWNTDASLDLAPYNYSKVLAEKHAWKLAKELDLNVVVMNPAFIVGPPVCATGGTTLKSAKSYVDGTYKPLEKNFGWVDVRDVAAAHLAALKSPAASGRYCLTSPTGFRMSEAAALLKERFPTAKLPEVVVPESRVAYDCSKAAKELGFSQIPLKQSMEDMIARLIELGAVKL